MNSPTLTQYQAQQQGKLSSIKRNANGIEGTQMMTGNQLASYRERTAKLLPMMNRKFCVTCGHSKSTTGGTSVLLSPLSNRRGFVCASCKEAN